MSASVDTVLATADGIDETALLRFRLLQTILDGSAALCVVCRNRRCVVGWLATVSRA
jgi:hypothetical protein